MQQKNVKQYIFCSIKIMHCTVHVDRIRYCHLANKITTLKMDRENNSSWTHNSGVDGRSWREGKQGGIERAKRYSRPSIFNPGKARPQKWRPSCGRAVAHPTASKHEVWSSWFCALILFIQTSVLYKSFTYIYLLTYLLTYLMYVDSSISSASQCSWPPASGAARI